MVLQIEGKPRAENVVADEPGVVRFGERLFATFVGIPDFAMDVVVAAPAAHRIGGDHHALDQRMRVVVHEIAVLERARLSLVGVADEVFVACELLRHEAPFEPGRKSRTAATTQRRLLNFGDHLVRGHLLGQHPAQRRVAVALLVVGQLPVLAVQPIQHDRFDVPPVEACLSAHSALIDSYPAQAPRAADRFDRRSGSCTSACC